MSKLADRLRTMDIRNNWELLQVFGDLGDVAVMYQRRAEGRAGIATTNKTTVWRPPLKGKPGVRREFIGKRSVSFGEAMKWVTTNAKYKLVPGPFGGHIPEHILEKAKAATKPTGDNK